ncbi:MAG: methionine--tRNA ligase [Alphaproteobacteria bacterium]
MNKPRYYITTPIYYVNDAPHLGHAYTSLACDVLARFKRLDGYEVHFLTGTDEHGQKVQKSAENAGFSCQEFTDKVSRNFRDLSKLMNFSNDDFIRTTEERHKKGVQHLWNVLLEKGYLYLSSYAGWYAMRDEAFYDESELKQGSDGKMIAPSGAPCEWVEEPSWFFKLSAFQEPLLAFFEANPNFIMPHSRRNEVISFVKSGLRDLSVSRTSFHWGIDIPNQPGHIMYVWLDALANYLSAIGYPNEQYKEHWPADLHMVGKDILRFHAVYWPAFLMAADIALPKRVFAHGWWTVEGQKMSKSLGNAITPQSLVEKYGLDPSRYFLLREVPFGQDGDFSHGQMQRRMNGELSNDLGNLAQRVLSMVQRYFEGMLPALPMPLQPEDKALLQDAHHMVEQVRKFLDEQAFHRALEAIWQVIGAANRYVDSVAPWKLSKENIIRCGEVLAVLVETIRHVAVVLQPFMPQASENLLNLLGIRPQQRLLADLQTPMSSGNILPPPQPLFPRLVEETP